MFVHAVWSLSVPPRVHFFLWLLSKNKLLTRDNLEKRRRIDDKSCLFCSKPESVHHLFFECVIARQIWIGVSEVIGVQIGQDIESVAKRWLCNKKFGLVNIISSAVCWSLWKVRNSLCFQEVAWLGMKEVWHRVIPMLKCWRVLVLVCNLDGFDAVVSSLEKLAMCLGMIAYMPTPRASDLVADGGRMGDGRGAHFDPP
jgi:hypothetical protein